jgi:hypothetical protein
MTELAPEMTFEEDRLRNIGPATIRPRRELARRVSGGIEVTLYWSPHDNSTSIEVWQSATERTLHCAVAREAALDAFHHPFAYLRSDEQTSAGAVRVESDGVLFFPVIGVDPNEGASRDE